MSEAPAEDAAEQRMPVSDDTLTGSDDQPETDEAYADYPVRQSDEVDPADAAEQNREVPDDEDDRR